MMNIHLHMFNLRMDTGHNKYYECRCGARMVKYPKEGYQPFDRDWLSNNEENIRTEFSNRRAVYCKRKS